MRFSGGIETPVGLLAVESDGAAIRRVHWPAAARSPDTARWPAAAPSPGAGPASVPRSKPRQDPLLTEALAQLSAYFSGERTTFDLPFDLGPQSDVTRAVLRALYETVAHGETVTYGELAERSGTSVPARGIGSIMGANPIPIIVPCHRVVASDGLGGYSGGGPGEGLVTKRWLLEHEGALPAALF